MNYNSIILEMLSRIQTLEEKVCMLEEMLAESEEPAAADEFGVSDRRDRVTTADVRDYIRQQLRCAAEEGREELILRAGDVQRSVGLNNRARVVCNAMRQCMGEGDVILHQTPSGYSTSLEILYKTEAYAEDADD